MPTTSPQLNVTQSILLTQAQILTLYSAPMIVCPAASGYANIFQSATLVYGYKNSVFTNVDNVINFQLVPYSGGDNSIVSNSLNATNILGLSQSTNTTFIPANPYPLLLDNSAIVLTISDSDPLGGDTGSSLALSITYAILQLT